MLYTAGPNLTIGFHGCDEKTRDKLLVNPNEVKISREKFDWLGNGSISGRIIMNVPCNGQKINKSEAL